MGHTPGMVSTAASGPRAPRPDDEVEIRVRKVEARQGPRIFQTRLDDWPVEVPGGRFLIRDGAGDLYRVSDPAAMDRRSREILWAFMG